MGKVKKFRSVGIRKITGGKDPVRLIEEFIARQDVEESKIQKDKDGDLSRWMIEIEKGVELELLLEGSKNSNETTIYLGVNVATVPLRGVSEVLTVALEIADGLVGVKLSLVGHYLVLSATLPASGLNIEDLEYHLKLLVAQQNWFREVLADELGWDLAAE